MDEERLAKIAAYWQRAKVRNEEGKFAALPDDVVDDSLWMIERLQQLSDVEPMTYRQALAERDEMR